MVNLISISITYGELRYNQFDEMIVNQQFDRIFNLKFYLDFHLFRIALKQFNLKFYNENQIL